VSTKDEPSPDMPPSNARGKRKERQTQNRERCEASQWRRRTAPGQRFRRDSSLGLCESADCSWCGEKTSICLPRSLFCMFPAGLPSRGGSALLQTRIPPGTKRFDRTIGLRPERFKAASQAMLADDDACAPVRQRCLVLPPIEGRRWQAVQCWVAERPE
jgi:hypothetical protein